MKNLLSYFLLFFILTSCTPATPVITPSVIRMAYSAAVEPWLPDVYACAGQSIVQVDRASADTFDLSGQDIAMRIGLPAEPTSSTFQIDTDALQVIANPENPVKRLTLAQVQGIFTGRIQNWKDVQGPDAPVNAWVFASAEDLQQLFEKDILQNSPATTLARLAVSPEAMIAAIAADPNAIGILTKKWKPAGTSILFTGTEVPVLVLTLSEPQGAVRSLIACLQK